MFKFFILILSFSFLGCSSIRHNDPVDNLGLMAAENQSPYLKDFGLVKAGEVVSHSFLIKNGSGKVLHIKGITTSCGCTVSEIKSKILNPGESTYLDVKFSSQGYSGPVEQFVYVQTDSLDESLIRFIIKANVVK